MTIDDLLSQPLPSVPDNGFSRRVMMRVRAAESRRMVLYATAAAAAATLVCLLVPMDVISTRVLGVISTQVSAAIVQIGSSTAVGLAAAAMLLTYLWDRQYFRL